MPHRGFVLAAAVGILLSPLYAQTADISGSWDAEFKDSLGNGTAALTLSGTGDNLSGQYRTNLGGVGTVAIHQQSEHYRFILTQTTDGCLGSYSGLLDYKDAKLIGTYSGNDCKGWHENGVVSLVRDGNSSSTQTAAQRASVHCDKAGSETGVPLWRDGNLVRNLACGEELTLLSQAGAGYIHVRTSKNEEGYVSQQAVEALKDTGSKSLSEVAVPVKQISPNTPIKIPTKIPVVPAPNREAEYPLAIRVLQTESVPYSVQVSGGGVSTNCAINGSTYTTGSATSIGNYTYGNATSNTNLRMNCYSQDVPPSQWRHVLNTMLVVASNGNAYIIACDAAWRWSKCRGLVTGDTFRAKMTQKGLAVQYFANNKPKEATYSVLQGKVLSQ